MAVIAAIFSDHFLFTLSFLSFFFFPVFFSFFFLELQGMVRVAAYQQLDVLPLKVAYLLWGPGIGFSLHYHLKKKKEGKR